MANTWCAECRLALNIIEKLCKVYYNSIEIDEDCAEFVLFIRMTLVEGKAVVPESTSKLIGIMMRR